MGEILSRIMIDKTVLEDLKSIEHKCGMGGEELPYRLHFQVESNPGCTYNQDEDQDHLFQVDASSECE